jgi:iron complex transport system ATP-binding protein
VITIDAVRKEYRSATGKVEIGPVTTEIPSGGVTALVGPNGAGKSTLLTMVGRLLGMDEGAIEVAGYDVASTSSRAASASAPTSRWSSLRTPSTCSSTSR